MITLDELAETCDIFPVHQPDPVEIRACATSPTSCCWVAGGPIRDSGWVELCAPTRMSSKGGRRTKFVCTQEEWDAAMEQ